MSSAVVVFVVQMIAGIVGSFAAGAALHEHRLGLRTSTVAGLVGGLAGYLVYAAIPAMVNGAGVAVLAVIMQRFERFSLLPTAFA